MPNKLMIFLSNRKKCRVLSFSRKKVMSEKNQGLQHRKEVEVGTLWLSNDRNNVIAENVSSYF